MPIDFNFHPLKGESLNKVFYAWVKIVSQQTKQDGDLEGSYQTHFAEKVLWLNSIENKREEPFKEKNSQSNPLFNRKGQSSHRLKPSVNKNSHLQETVWQIKMFFFSFSNHKISIKGGCLGLSYASEMHKRTFRSQQ